jgi:hypothetical protein
MLSLILITLAGGAAAQTPLTCPTDVIPSFDDVPADKCPGDAAPRSA